jgi:hypothetical protein
MGIAGRRGRRGDGQAAHGAAAAACHAIEDNASQHIGCGGDGAAQARRRITIRPPETCLQRCRYGYFNSLK